MKNTFTPPDRLDTYLTPGSSLYLAGICGVSMASLAHLAVSRGYQVRGCDRDTASPVAERLRLAGIVVEEEAEANPCGADLLVFSLALSDTSQPIRRAHTYGIPCVSRIDLLAYLTHDFPCRVAVAGMHGKSTTVGMLSAILTRAGRCPTVLSGAPLTVGGDTYLLGGQEIALVEACEYCDSFLALRPTLGVVTNIELDHPDYFPSLTAVENSFSHFLWHCEDAIIGGDCPALHALAHPSVWRFGLSAHCDVRGVTSPDGLLITEDDVPLGTLALSVAGDYNRENALAATAAARRLGIPFPLIKEALDAFRGIGRRMEHIGYLPTADHGSVAVYLDYAHHPTELTAAIRAAESFGGRVLVVFQPHTYTRTQALWDAFITALRLPAVTVLTDIYAAREAAIGGVSSSSLAAAAGVLYAPSPEDAVSLLRDQAHGGDTLLILGAGDVDRIRTLL